MCFHNSLLVTREEKNSTSPLDSAVFVSFIGVYEYIIHNYIRHQDDVGITKPLMRVVSLKVIFNQFQ